MRVDRVNWGALPLMSQRRAKRVAEAGALSLWGSVRESQQAPLADLERGRAERDGEGGNGDV